MERRDPSYRPERVREFDTGQLYQEFRFADLSRDTDGRKVFFEPTTKIYLSSRSHENGTSYYMVMARPMFRGDILHSFFHYMGTGMDHRTLTAQIQDLSLDADADREVSLLGDVVGESDNTSLASAISERLTSLDYCWDQLIGNRRYVRQLLREGDEEIPRLTMVDHGDGLANVMRMRPELWKSRTSPRSIAAATKTRALSRLSQLSDQVRRSVFESELQDLPEEERGRAVVRRVVTWHDGIPLIMGNNELGVLLSSGSGDIQVKDLHGGLHKMSNGRSEVTVDIFGNPKHFADIYSTDNHFVIPTVTWEKTKHGIRTPSDGQPFYTGPSTIEKLSRDERIRIIQSFAPWQLNTLAGVMSLGISNRYEAVNNASNASEVIDLIKKEQNYILNNPLIENAEKLAVF